jgi:ABC-2 type transport system permease protein
MLVFTRASGIFNIPSKINFEDIIMKKYLKTAWMTAQNQTNAGIFYLLPNYILKIVYLIPLIFLWKTLMNSGVETGMTLKQMLTYTYMSSLLAGLLVIRTPLGSWMYEGLITSLYQRPMSIYGHVIAQTLGSNAVTLMLFSIPIAIVSPFIGIYIAPVSWWFIPSLILCISLGFAMDFIFACIMIRMVNATWLVYSIRGAIVLLFSGSVFPFKALPWGLGKILIYQPFGSLGGATLAIYTGLSTPCTTLLIQLIWNVVFWVVAIVAFKKSQERLVSQGG